MRSPSVKAEFQDSISDQQPHISIQPYSFETDLRNDASGVLNCDGT